METITITIEELNQRIEEKLMKTVRNETKTKPLIMPTNSEKLWKNGWNINMEREPTPKYKAAIYESVKACLGIRFISQLSEETYENALKIFEEQKLFFQRRVFPEDCQPKELEEN